MITTRTKIIAFAIAVAIICGVIWAAQDEGEAVYSPWAGTH
jgi:hypothetical protein